MTDTTNNQTAATTNPAFDPAYKAALDTRRPAFQAISEDNVLYDLRLDASRSSDIAEGSARKLVPHRAAIAARFGEENATLVDGLITTARACRQADVEFTLAQPTGDMSPLAAEVSNAHTMLMADATSLVKRGVIDGQRLERARDIKGYQPLVASTLVLVTYLREQWPAIEGKSILTKEDLDRAEHVTLMLATALAHRDQKVDLVPARNLRARAITMLVRDYAELRRMMLYLRYYHDDADEIIPSLYARRGRSSRTDREEPVEGEPTNGAPTNGTPEGPTPPPTPGDDESPFTP